MTSRRSTQRPSLVPDRFFQFSYPIGGEDEHSPLHALRDGPSFAELATVLAAQGARYGGLIINIASPSDGGPPEPGPKDLIVLATRPPLNDGAIGRRIIPKSNTMLERQVLRVVARYFEECSRARVIWGPDMAAHLEANQQGDRAVCDFYVYKGPEYPYKAATYRHCRPRGSAKRRDLVARRERKAGRDHHEPSGWTAAYLVLARLHDGPMLLNAFGMDGVATLIWCRLLATKYRHLLASPRVVMAELDVRNIPKRPSSLEFTADMPVKILLDVPA